jgi:hypothetical protein
MKGPTIDMTGLTDQAGRFLRRLRSRTSDLWARYRPEVRKRGGVALEWVKERWGDHLHRGRLLCRWMRRRYSPERPVRSILWASVRLLWGTSHELLGWPSAPPTEDEWKPFEPEFAPCTPDLNPPFSGLPEVGDLPPPPGELPPPPEV